MSEPITQEAAQGRRLHWRIRRGTRELDLLLGTWLEKRLSQADHARQQAFDALLGVADPDLWDWMMGRTVAPRADWQAIIDDIRTDARL